MAPSEIFSVSPFVALGDAAPALEAADPDSRADLARSLYDAKRFVEAAAAWRMACDADPTRFSFAVARADAEAAAGDVMGAERLYRDLLDLRPGSTAARLGLGRLLRHSARPHEAVETLREGTLFDPDDGELARELAASLLVVGEVADGVAVLQRRLRREPADAAAMHLLAEAWRQLGETAREADALRGYLALAPDDPMGAAARLGEIENGAPINTPAYIRTLFDQYADRFDAHLVGKLGYRAPQALRDALAERLGSPRADRAILDLGCGTGLAGVELAPWAKRMKGVDLSPKMLERAAERGVYGELAVQDLTMALQEETAVWDVIVAADVLIYVGDLGPCFAALSDALKPGGAFAATIESLDGDGDFRMGDSRRFVYSRAYVERVASSARLRSADWREIDLRREKGRPVRGWLFILERIS